MGTCTPRSFVWFEGGFCSFCLPLSNKFDQPHLLQVRTEVAGCPFPTHASFVPSGAQPPRAGTSRPLRARVPASFAVRSATAASRALRPRAGWPGQRIQMGPQGRPRRSASGPEAGAGPAGGGAAEPAAPLPGARRWRPQRAARPCFAGCLRASPAPPRQPDSGPPHPTAGFVHRPRGRPSPFPPAPPRPLPAGPTSSALAAGAGRGRRG